MRSPARDKPASSAHTILHRHGLEWSIPVPILRLCQREGLLGVSQTAFEDSSISGMIRRTDRGSTIYVAKSLSATHQRFTIAHELAHYLLHFRHASEPSHCIDRTDVYARYRHPEQANEREREANW